MCLKLDIRENLDYTWNIPEGETKVYTYYVAGFILFCKGHNKMSPNNKIRCFIFEINREQGKTKCLDHIKKIFERLDKAFVILLIKCSEGKK